MSSTDGTVLRRRPPWRFTLRTLLFVWTLFLIWCGWLGWYVHRARQYQNTASAIRAAGGRVGFDWEYDRQFHRIYQATAPGPEWLTELVGAEVFQTPIRVEWGGDAMFDDDLEHLEDFAEIWELYLPYSKITDDGLRTIAKLTSLEELSLESCNITDAGLAHIAGMRNLAELNLERTNVSDAGLVHLARLPRLQAICLRNTAVTDAGLRILKQQRPLAVLSLQQTAVSEDAARDLIEDWPNCSIVLDDLRSPQSLETAGLPFPERRSTYPPRFRIHRGTVYACIASILVGFACCASGLRRVGLSRRSGKVGVQVE